MKKIITLITLSFCLLNIKEIKAQPEFEDGVEDTPIDSISGLLIISAIIFGIKNHKNSITSDNFSKKSR